MIAHAYRQLWREPRITAVLLAAVTLVTAFAALAPLYVRMVSAAELDVRLTTLTPRQQRLELTNDAPFGDEVTSILESGLGETILSTHRFAFAPTRFCNIGTADGSAPLYRPCYRLYTYPDLTAEFMVVEGRLPAPNPDVIEIALTREALEKGLVLDPNFRFEVGGRYKIADDVNIYDAELVGLVETYVPEGDPHWDGQNTIFGAIIQVQGNAPDELDLGLIVHPGALAGEFDALGPRAYFARATMALTGVRTAELDDLGGRLEAVLATVRQRAPLVSVFSPVSTLISEFQTRVAEVSLPVLLLVALTMVLLLYTLITTGALILDRARTAWAQMAGRGASARQLIAMHGLAMSTLGLAAWLLSVPLAVGFAVALAALGPQAGVIDYPSLSDIPAESFIFGGAAAVLSVAALVLPGVPAAFTSFARLKSESGRPAQRPLWARYYVDVILFGLGLAFVLRARSSLADLSDPFSLAGPALLLTGAAMLWLRLFPLLMRAVGAALGALNQFGIRLAFWGLERDPGSTGQLVMLVVGALALGTASLVLSHTRADSAWDTARGEINADALLMVEPTQHDATYDYTQLQGVVAAAGQIELNTGDSPGRMQARLIGYVDPDTPVLAPLAAADDVEAGLEIPADAVRFSVDAYSEASDPPTAVHLALEFTNGDYLRVQLPLQSADPTAAGTWTTHAAEIDRSALGRGPYRLTAVRIVSERNEGRDRFGELNRFDHTLYLWNVRAETADGETIELADLTEQPETMVSRPADADSRSSVLAFGLNDEVRAPDGGPALRVLYNRNGVIPNQPPALALYDTDAPIPVVITEAFARSVGDRSSLRRMLQVGDAVPFDFTDPKSPFQRLRLTYEVMAVVDAPPPHRADEAMLITRADWLQSQLNRRRSSLETGTGINRVRLTLDDRVPPAELRDRLATLPGVEIVDFAYDRFAALQRAPLANAVTGMLFAGFCAAFGLIVLQAGFYTAVTLRRRAASFAVLRALGWGSGNVVRMLAIEQAAIVLPALAIGVIVGTGLAALLIPLLGVAGGPLSLPLAQIAGLLATVGVLFAALLAWSVNMLRGADVAQQVRTVD